MHFGRETVLVTIDAEFDRERKAGDLIGAVDEIQKAIRERYPEVKYITSIPKAATGSRPARSYSPPARSRAA